MIPVFKPTWTEEELNDVADVIRSGWWGMGPKVLELEKRFAKRLGVKHAIALNSGTAALDLAYRVLGLAQSEVITTPMTFISTNSMILQNVATPVFCDIEPDTLNIDPGKIEKLITNKTKAIVVVHYGGHACDMDKILKIARKYKLAVVEDAAHAAGSAYKGKPIGSFGDLACFSFHAVKNMACGDGGMVVTDNDGYAERIRKLRWVGISKDTWQRTDKDAASPMDAARRYSWYYDVVEPGGHKFQLTDIHAAIALVQFRRLNKTNARRRALSARYNRGLANVAWIEVPVEKDYTRSAMHNYVIKTPYRDALHDYLEQNGISTGVHYIPNNLYESYKAFGQPTPIAHARWTQLLTLPLFPDLANNEADYVIKTIRSFKP
jgi:perosamine synthetase